MNKIWNSFTTASLCVGLSGAALADSGVQSFPAPESKGPFAPVIEADSSLQGFTIYRPQKMTKMLPLVVWGNGACVAKGGMYRGFLSEIASRGYLVISLGAFGPEDVSTMKPPAPPKPGAPPALPKDFKTETTWQQMIDAVDWAKRQDEDTKTRFFGKIDMSEIAVMGHSCGGLQAEIASLDPRITTTVLLDSGAFKAGETMIPGIDFTAADVIKLRAPILYLEGGPTDIAYPQGKLNYENTQVPTAFVNLDVGHRGTYARPQGDAFAEVTTAWLDWQLKGDANTKNMFLGDKCGLCTGSKWTIERKNWQ